MYEKQPERSMVDHHYGDLPRPINLLYSDYPGDDASSVSQSEPLVCQPQHKSLYEYPSQPVERASRYFKTNTHRTMVDGRPMLTAPRRQIQRSRQLQIAMNRIEQRKKAEMAAKADIHRREQPEKVEQVLEMISTYDVVLDHLIRKNRNLKAYARREQSDRYPRSDQTMASSAIVDTLDLLRREREATFGRGGSERNAVSMPIPRADNDSGNWGAVDGLQRGDSFQREKPVGSRHEQRQDQRLGRTHNDHKAWYRDDGYVAENFNECRNIGKYEGRGHYYDEIGYENETQSLKGRYRESRDGDVYEEYQNNDIYYSVPSDYHESIPGRVDVQHQRYIGYEDRHHHGPERVDQRNSRALSELLPEQIPPKIKETRDRLARFRHSQYRAALEHEMREHAHRSPREHCIVTSPRKASPRYRRPSNFRPGSPERPYDLVNCDRYGRPIETSKEADPYHYRHTRPRPKPVRIRETAPVPPREPRTFSEPDRFCPRDSPSLSPIEQARDLAEQVEGMYRFSKEVTASNEQLQHDFRRIQEMSTGRRDVNDYLRRQEYRQEEEAEGMVQQSDRVPSKPKAEIRARPRNILPYRPPASPDTTAFSGLNPLEVPEQLSQPTKVQVKVERCPADQLEHNTNNSAESDKGQTIRPTAKQPGKSARTNPSAMRPPSKIAIVKSKKMANYGNDFPDLLAVCSDEACNSPGLPSDKFNRLSSKERNRGFRKNGKALDGGTRAHHQHSHRQSLLAQSSNDVRISRERHYQEDNPLRQTESLEITKAKEALYSDPILLPRRASPSPVDCGCGFQNT